MRYAILNRIYGVYPLLYLRHRVWSVSKARTYESVFRQFFQLLPVETDTLGKYSARAFCVSLPPASDTASLLFLSL